MSELRIGRPALAALVTSAFLVGVASAAEVTFRDEFDALDLAAGWQILNENTETHSLLDRTGFLRVQTERGDLNTESGVANLVVRELSGDFIIETMLEFDPRGAVHYAGLLVYADNGNIVTFGFTHASGERGEFRGVVLLSFKDGVEGADRPGARYDETSSSSPNAVHLRLLRSGSLFVAGFSEDGEEYTDVGSITVDLPDEVLVGVGATNGDFDECGIECDASIAADFDFFQVSTIDTSSGDDPPDVVVLESITLDGPEAVESGSSRDFAATAVFTDGSTVDVTDEAVWTLAPSELGDIDAGVLTAATVETTQQATLVIAYTQHTSGGVTTTETDSMVVRIEAPSSGNGSPCGAGLACIGLCLVMPLIERCRRVGGARSRNRRGPGF